MTMKDRVRIAGALAVTVVALGALVSPARAQTGGDVNTFSGSCSVQGTAHFAPWVTPLQPGPAWLGDTGPGTCTGTLDGRTLSNAPVNFRAGAPVYADGCSSAHTTAPGTAEIGFAGGTAIDFTFQFSGVLTEYDLTITGERSGTGHGHASFLTSRAQPQGVVDCSGVQGGLAEAPIDITATTDTTLVSDRQGAPSSAFSPPPTPGLQFGMRFTSTVPETRTGAHLTGTIPPTATSAKPSPLTGDRLDLPDGARFDGGAVPACTATDQEIDVLGPAACPASSQVGSGTITVITGFGPPVDPATTDVTVFNWGGGTVEVVTQPGTDATLAIDRGDFTGPGQLTNHPPSAPGGPPDFQASVKTVDIVYAAAGDSSGRSFITTPSTCTSGGEWTSRSSIATADGKTYTATADTPCTTGGAALRPAAVAGGGDGPAVRAATVVGLPVTGAAETSAAWAWWAAMLCLLVAAGARVRRMSGSRLDR